MARETAMARDSANKIRPSAREISNSLYVNMPSQSVRSNLFSPPGEQTNEEGTGGVPVTSVTWDGRQFTMISNPPRMGTRQTSQKTNERKRGPEYPYNTRVRRAREGGARPRKKKVRENFREGGRVLCYQFLASLVRARLSKRRLGKAN